MSVLARPAIAGGWPSTGDAPQPAKDVAGGTDAPHVQRLIAELETALCTDLGRAAEAAERAVAEAAGRDDLAAETVAAYHLAKARRLAGDDAAALAACDRAERAAAEAGADVWRARAMACRALVHHEVGDDEEAVDLLTAAVDLCRQAGDGPALAESLTVLGQTCTALPPLVPRAAAALAEARRLWLAVGDPDGAAATQVQIAANYLATARLIGSDNRRGAAAAARRAAAAASSAVQEADACGSGALAVAARLALAEALIAAEDDRADRVLDAAAAMLRDFPSGPQQLVVHRLRAERLSSAGRLAESVEEARRGLALRAADRSATARSALLETVVVGLEAMGDLHGALVVLHELYDLTSTQVDDMAGRRATLLSARLDTGDALRRGELERRRLAVLERRNSRLSWEATHDRLTGLPNRRMLDEELAARIATDRPLAALLIDIDHFKRVNDECSHQTGDRVLARLGQVLGDGVRPGDLAARYGGEEFVVLLDVVDRLGLLAAAERLRAAVADLRWPVPVPDGQVTISVGGAIRLGNVTAADLLDTADRALYRAKDAGRNRCVLA